MEKKDVVLVQEPRPAPLADRLFLASILSIFTAPSLMTKAPAFHCECLYRKYCWNRGIPRKDSPMFSAPAFTGCCMQVVQLTALSPLYRYVGAPQTKNIYNCAWKQRIRTALCQFGCLLYITAYISLTTELV